MVHQQMKPSAKSQEKRYFQCCLSMIILLTFACNRRFYTFVPFHKWRNKTFRQCSQMRIPWVRIKYRSFNLNLNIRFFTSNRFDGKNARSWLWQTNKCSPNTVTSLLGRSMFQTSFQGSCYNTFCLVCRPIWWTNSTVLWSDLWRLWPYSWCLEG